MTVPFYIPTARRLYYFTILVKLVNFEMDWHLEAGHAGIFAHLYYNHDYPMHPRFNFCIY